MHKCRGVLDQDSLTHSLTHSTFLPSLHLVNSTIKPASGIKIGNGALKLNFVGVGLGLQGDYNVTLSNKTNAGSVGVYTELGIRGDLRIVRGSNGDLNVLIP